MVETLFWQTIEEIIPANLQDEFNDTLNKDKDDD